MINSLTHRAISPVWSCSRSWNDAIPILYQNSRRNPQARYLHSDHRNRRSNFWVPAPRTVLKDVKKDESSHELLVRAGFIFQTQQNGFFHMLPLGCRVQDKIEALIEKHMRAIGASRLSMSTISSSSLWEQSGRLNKVKSELFFLQDRRQTQLLLSPTHEEEITSLISQSGLSKAQLPLKLYQITRKYRDEPRPRAGLLRAREFVMKDLYTFDLTTSSALETYHQVRDAYSKIFAELKLPIEVAEASSGSMGGNLSHEYHLPSVAGEDELMTCSNCGYLANTEIAVPPPQKAQEQDQFKPEHIKVWRGVSHDRKTLINVWYPSSVTTGHGGATSSDTYGPGDINTAAIKSLIPELDDKARHSDDRWDQILRQADEARRAAAEAGGASPAQPPPPAIKSRLVNLVDKRIPPKIWKSLERWRNTVVWPTQGKNKTVVDLLDVSEVSHGEGGTPLDLLKTEIKGQPCPSCGPGTLDTHRAIELGHTFHLGTRYSEPFAVSLPGEQGGGSAARVPLQMGCYGIGVSRILSAVAAHLADDKCLHWPRAIAPFEVLVVPAHQLDAAAVEVYDFLARPGDDDPTARPLDLLLDDRPKTVPYKLNDADIVGYPVTVVVGRAWRDGLRACEVQCRRLGVKEEVPLEKLHTYIRNLLDQL